MPDNDDLPASGEGMPSGRDEFGRPRQGVHPLGARRAPHQREGAVAHRPRVLEALLLGERGHPLPETRHHLPRVPGEEVGHLGRDQGILLDGLASDARRAASPHVGEGAGRARPGGGEPLETLAQRNHLVDGGDGRLGG